MVKNLTNYPWRWYVMNSVINCRHSTMSSLFCGKYVDRNTIYSDSYAKRSQTLVNIIHDYCNLYEANKWKQMERDRIVHSLLTMLSYSLDDNDFFWNSDVTSRSFEEALDIYRTALQNIHQFFGYEKNSMFRSYPETGTILFSRLISVMYDFLEIKCDLDKVKSYKESLVKFIKILLKAGYTNFNRIPLTGLDLKNQIFEKCYFKYCATDESNLSGAVFKGCYIEKLKLPQTLDYVSNVKFINCDIKVLCVYSKLHLDFITFDPPLNKLSKKPFINYYLKCGFGNFSRDFNYLRTRWNWLVNNIFEFGNLTEIQVNQLATSIINKGIQNKEIIFSVKQKKEDKLIEKEYNIAMECAITLEEYTTYEALKNNLRSLCFLKGIEELDNNGKYKVFINCYSSFHFKNFLVYAAENNKKTAKNASEFLCPMRITPIAELKYINYNDLMGILS